MREMSETGIFRLKRRQKPTITNDFSIFPSLKKGRGKARLFNIFSSFSPKKKKTKAEMFKMFNSLSL